MRLCRVIKFITLCRGRSWFCHKAECVIRNEALKTLHHRGPLNWFHWCTKLYGDCYSSLSRSNRKHSIPLLVRAISGQIQGCYFYFYAWPTSSSTWSHTQSTGSYLSGVQSRSPRPEDSGLCCWGLIINTNGFSHSLWWPLTKTNTNPTHAGIWRA